MGEQNSVVKYKSRDGQEIDLSFEIVRQFLVSGKKELVTPQELFYFMGVCKSRGLNPFKKDCYLIKYSTDPAAIVTSIDFYRSRAKAQKDCVGWRSGIIVKKGNTVENREGELLLEGEILVGGWFEAQPEGWKEPLKHTVNLRPFIKKTREGEVTKFWHEDNQPMMIRKVAEAQGLRKLWPDEFQQIYYEGEIVAEERDPTIEMENLAEYGRKAIQMPGEKKPPETEKPREGTAKDTLFIMTGIDNVTEKSGTGKDKKPFTIYNIHVGEKKYTTFNKTIAEDGMKAMSAGLKVDLEYRNTTYGPEIVSLKLQEPPEENAQ